MIPIADHEWYRLDDYFLLPDSHHAEVAEIEGGGIVVRIVGPNAHVFGEGRMLDDAADEALTWFYRVGGKL